MAKEQSPKGVITADFSWMGTLARRKAAVEEEKTEWKAQPDAAPADQRSDHDRRTAPSPLAARFNVGALGD